VHSGIASLGEFKHTRDPVNRLRGILLDLVDNLIGPIDEILGLRCQRINAGLFERGFDGGMAGPQLRR